MAGTWRFSDLTIPKMPTPITGTDLIGHLQIFGSHSHPAGLYQLLSIERMQIKSTGLAMLIDRWQYCHA
jgi:hypothetical protein